MKFCLKFLALVLAAIIFAPVQVSAESEVTRVILVRHGETTFNKTGIYYGWLDAPLDETGIRQAEALAKYLKDVPIDVFIASPLQRAYVTTQKVAELHGMQIEYTDPRFREINFGDWEGKSAAEVQEKYPELNAMLLKKPWLVILPNGESLDDLANRASAALNDTVARYPGKTIFIGAHYIANTVMICRALGIGLEHVGQIRQNNTGINVLEYKDGAWRALVINSTAHLNKIL